MTKSIENIWQQGFMQPDALIAPKINDLYSKKSNMLADKVIRLYSFNLKFVLGLMGFIFIIFSAQGAPFLGAYIVLLLAYVLHVGKAKLKHLKSVDKGLDCYHYLVSVNQWLKQTYADFIAIYKIFYPLMFAGMYLQFTITDEGSAFNQNLLNAVGQSIAIGGVSLGTVIIGLLGTAFFYWCGDSIGKFDIDLFYKRIAKKLDDMVAEMDELREGAT